MNSEPELEPTAAPLITNPQLAGYPPGSTLVALQPAPNGAGGAAGDSPQSPIRHHAILGAIRRRWFIALSLGLIMGCGAAVGVWYSVPETYTSFAELIITPGERFLYSERETRDGGPDLTTYKQTMSRLATYPFVLTAALRDEEVAACETIREKAHPEDWLGDNLQISSPASQFLRVSLTAPRAKDAQLIVASVVDAFKREVIDVKRQEKLKKQEELRGQIRAEENEMMKLQQELSRREKEVSAANKEMADLKFQSLNGIALELRKNLGQIEWEILSSEIELEQLQAAAQVAKERELAAESTPAADGDPLGVDLLPEESPDVSDTPAVAALDSPQLPEIPDEIIEAEMLKDQEFQELAGKLQHYEVQITLLKKRLAPTNSRIVETQAEIDRLTAGIDSYREQQAPAIREALTEQLRERLRPAPGTPQALEQEQQNLPVVDRVAMAKSSLAKQRMMRARILEELEARQVEVRDLGSLWVDRELQAEKVAKQKALLDGLLSLEYKRAVELQYEEDHPPIKISREAAVPSSPDQTQRIKLSAAAGLGALGLVAAGILLLEYSARRLTSVTEVQTDLNLPVMATIPMMPRWLNTMDDPVSNQKSVYWHSVLTESVDTARTLLLRHARTDNTQVVMIASSVGGEGKTTLSCHLATSLARSGRKVLLIDGDLRRPGIHSVYNLSNEVGFAELLADGAELTDAIHEVEPEGLSVLPAGRISTQTLRALAQDNASQLMDVLREKFEFIILDSSPILLTTDALLMAQFVDGVLMSIRKDVSRVAKVAASVQRLSMLGVNMLGAVAIGLDDGPVTSRYNSAYGYGYGYGYGYHNLPSGPGATTSTS